MPPTTSKYGGGRRFNVGRLPASGHSRRGRRPMRGPDALKSTPGVLEDAWRRKGRCDSLRGWDAVNGTGGGGDKDATLEVGDGWVLGCLGR